MRRRLRCRPRPDTPNAAPGSTSVPATGGEGLDSADLRRIAREELRAGFTQPAPVMVEVQPDGIGALTCTRIGSST